MGVCEEYDSVGVRERTKRNAVEGGARVGPACPSRLRVNGERTWGKDRLKVGKFEGWNVKRERKIT